MRVQAKFDVSQVLSGLENLRSVQNHLARSMCVAGGKVLRDEAKVRAPVGTDEGGSKSPGALQRSIYLAYRDKESTDTRVVYQVSWNAKKAPHGHLLEFGHWQTRAAYKGGDGDWHSGKPLDAPKWVPAHPFLRPAFDAAHRRAQEAMIARGRQRLIELMSDKNYGGDDIES